MHWLILFSDIAADGGLGTGAIAAIIGEYLDNDYFIALRTKH